MRLDREFVQQVRERNDLVEVVGEYLPLERRGRDYVGLCPFHAERTPSFSVSSEKQLFYCFGCGEGGDLFTFVMRKDGLNFPEAVVQLAERVGLAVPEAEDPAALERWRQRESLQAVLEAACAFYSQMLSDPREGRPGREYLAGRGVTDQVVEQFRLGYAPAEWDALGRHLRQRGFSPELAERAGLLVRKERGFYDRFRGRVLFPIADRRGQVIAFGGRSLDGAPPKYLNSPETDIFAKRRTLYGYHLAREGIRREGRVLLMEGYMDVVTAHQFGLDNAVGSLGTSLTPEQVRLLADQTSEVVMAFDADAAGQKAARRGLEVFSSLPCDVRVLVLPEGKDPDEFLHRRGPDALRQVAADAPHWVQFLLEASCAAHDVTTAEGKSHAVKDFLSVLDRLESLVERDEYVERLARRLRVSVETVQAEAMRLGSVRRDISMAGRHKIQERRENLPSQGDRTYLAERTIVALMLQDAAARRRVLGETESGDFQDAELRSLVETMQENPDAGWDALYGGPAAGEIAATRGAQTAAQLLMKLPLDNPERQLSDCLEVLRGQKRERRLQEVKAALDGQDIPDPALLRELQELLRPSKA